MYLNGTGGLQKSEAEAASWYRKAAEQGLSTAQNNLGSLSEQGRGVPQNFVEAYMWYSLAAASGHEEAAKNRDNVAKKMTAGQIADAQRRAAELTARLRN
jgi:TPR repeat protein